MKTEEKIKKLVLRRETVRELGDSELKQAAGASGPPTTSIHQDTVCTCAYTRSYRCLCDL